MTSFAGQWNAHFPKSAPIGYLLRTRYPQRWTRFHALPKSKRDAGNAFETRQILKRANAIACRLFTPEDELWLASCAGRIRKNSTSRLELPGLQLLLTYQTSFVEVADGDFFETQTELEVFATRTKWCSGCFSNLLEAIAQDKTRAVWFSSKTGRVFAPYDGGFDVMLESRFRVASIESRFANWMSEMESRL